MFAKATLRFWHLPTLVLTLTVMVDPTPTKVIAAPIGLMERFALAEDREAILAELIPGSQDYYFYHCLHYQNTGQLDQAEATLKQWIAQQKGRMSSATRAMMDRQRLLTFDQTPQQTTDYFVRTLGIRLQHSPPARKGTRRYATKLVDFIDTDALVKQSLRDNVKLSPHGMQIAADWFLANQDNQVSIKLKDFLKRVNGSYLVGLDRLVAKELLSRSSRDVRFGDLAAHQFLTHQELDNVGRVVPAITDDNAFVNAKLACLRPSGEIDLSQQPEERRSYLSRVENYVRGLPAAYNSLKASSAYRLLEANLEAGVWDLALFERYLQLPRQSPIINPILARSGFRANLRQDYMDIAILPPIGDEQLLVEAYLEHFLRDARDTRQFDRYLQPEFLRRVFARTKLMSGIANQEPYYEMLSAAERQQLRDKMQLSFAPNNPRQFASDKATELLVDVKNIDKLVVRVYEMNSLAYYRSNKRPLNTDVDLDGLIATHERTLEYDRPQIEKHRERIAIPEINGRGVWIVDLVGKGLRARALVRRGDLQTVRSRDANGMRFTVLDENRKLIPGARMIVGNQEFKADKNARINLPLVNKSGQATAILSDGMIAKSIKFRQLEESYSLDAGFFVDRTLLQTGGTAQVIVRPKLTLGADQIDPSSLEEATIRIVATDLEGIETAKQFDELKLDQAEDLALKFRVPPRVARIGFSLSGHVVGLSDRRHRELSTSHTIDLAGIRNTTQIADAFLSRDGDDFVIDTLGRSGEPIPSATIRLVAKTNVGDVEKSTYLQSDESGRVHLGKLQDVVQLDYGINGQSGHSIDLRLNQQVWPSALHLSAEQALKLPIGEDRNAANYRLLEIRDRSNLKDLSTQLSVSNGFLVSKELAPGDYKLVDREDGEETQIVVVEGETIDNVLVGKIRHRTRNLAPSLSIKSLTRNGDGSLSIELSGNTELARIHLVASRYFDDRFSLRDFHRGLPALSGRRLSLERSGYVGDLRLGDEYEYVLRRRYAAKYPGVMLPQPSVLLNPWETETTSNSSQMSRSGDAPPASPKSAAPMDSIAAAALAANASSAGSPDYDFLADSGVIAANLRADAQGRLTIPADALEGMPIVQVIVADPVNVVRRTITNKQSKAERLDLRLAQSLPVAKPYSFERAVSVVSKESPLDLATLGSAQVQVYASVGSLMSLYRTLAGDKRFDEFQDLGQWHTLSPEQKLDLYSELASHELHLFMRMHDREFFDAVIKPYLSNKKEKQFIDHWLLDEDLSEFTTLWRYRRLSAAERALLAIRVPQLRDQVRRDLSEKVSLMEEDYDQVRSQVESALRAKGLEDRFGEIADRLAPPSGGMGGGAFGDVGVDFFMDDEVAAEVEAVPSRRGMSRSQSLERLKRESSLEFRVKESAGAGGRILQSRGGKPTNRLFYQQLDTTKQWAESNWDRIRVVGGPASPNLLPDNPFWSDLASSDFDGSGSPAVSRNLLRCASNRHSALVALALCGLPLKAGEVSLPTKPKPSTPPNMPWLW